jgi:hypothetical protein
MSENSNNILIEILESSIRELKRNGATEEDLKIIFDKLLKLIR